MEFKKIYEVYSLIVGLGANLTLLWGIFLGLFFGIRFQLHEPIIIIAVIEILIGFSVIPYYTRKIKILINHRRF